MRTDFLDGLMSTLKVMAKMLEPPAWAHGRSPAGHMPSHAKSYRRPQAIDTTPFAQRTVTREREAEIQRLGRRAQRLRKNGDDHSLKMALKLLPRAER